MIESRLPFRYNGIIKRDLKEVLVCIIRVAIMKLLARPRKPEGVDNKSAYIVGSGLAALTAACYLVRDGQMKGKRIHILEKGDLPGGACDGYKFENVGYVMRGGREMDNHFEVMWDLFRSIPSIETGKGSAF